MHLEFANAHHHIPAEEKMSVALGKGSSPKFWGSPLLFEG